MKLKHFTRQDAYRFILEFENGEINEADLQELIGDYVDIEALSTAHLDIDWGCLEFKGGRVDIEPKTLYNYIKKHETCSITS
jgi:hypothetical protein